MKNYIINERTLFLEKQKEKVIIHELFTKGETSNSIKKILNDSCLFYGSTLRGRLIFSKEILNESYKNPIFINEKQLLIVFPLTALRNKEALLVVYNNIDKYHQISKSKVLVKFKNGDQHTFHVSYYIFHQQILKCSRLLVIYKARYNEFCF